MSTDFAAQLAEYQAEFAAAWDGILATTPGERIRTGFGGSLVVVTRSYPAGTEVDAVVDGTATPDLAILTEDGRMAHLVPHTGPVTGDSVYVEKWTGPRSRPFHGYIDPTSRQIVQWG